jgi:hypothetical protein
VTFWLVVQCLNQLRHRVPHKNEYQEYFLGGKGSQCIGLTTLLPSRANCLEIWEPQLPWNPQGLSWPVQGLLYLYLTA